MAHVHPVGSSTSKIVTTSTFKGKIAAKRIWQTRFIELLGIIKCF